MTGTDWALFLRNGKQMLAKRSIGFLLFALSLHSSQALAAGDPLDVLLEQPSVAAEIVKSNEWLVQLLRNPQAPMEPHTTLQFGLALFGSHRLGSLVGETVTQLRPERDTGAVQRFNSQYDGQLGGLVLGTSSEGAKKLLVVHPASGGVELWHIPAASLVGQQSSSLQHRPTIAGLERGLAQAARVDKALATLAESMQKPWGAEFPQAKLDPLLKLLFGPSGALARDPSRELGIPGSRAYLAPEGEGRGSYGLYLGPQHGEQHGALVATQERGARARFRRVLVPAGRIFLQR